MSASRLATAASDQAAVRSAERRRAVLALCCEGRMPLRVLAEHTGYAETGALRDDVRRLVEEGLLRRIIGRNGGFIATQQGRAWLAGAR